MNQETGLTPLGKIISGVLIAGLLVVGVVVFNKKSTEAGGGTGPLPVNSDNPASMLPSGLEETQSAVPTLSPAGPYRMKDGILDVDISEYPGYAGLIVANGGLQPSENSLFYKNHGFKVRIQMSEEESWDKLNSGKVGASVTTTDVLAVLGRQFQVAVPLLIAFSRGADGIVVRSDVKRLNNLQGKVVASIQFTEADFFIRFLAQEAGIGIQALPSLGTPPDAQKINLVYAKDGETSGAAFLEELGGAGRLAGCVTWAPTTSETVDKSAGKARLLTTNRNLLIISDILVLNKSFATENPKIVSGLVEGWLEGNRLVRENSSSQIAVISQAFKWSADQTRTELEKVHLANLPENEAYFSGAIDAAGSFGSIYQSAVLAYGPELIADAPPFERFLDLSHIQGLRSTGKFAEQKISLAPIKSSGGGALENDPLLTKDIRFFFDPNSATLIQDTAAKDGQSNFKSMEDVARLARVSPGSVLLLVGHVDDARRQEFEAQGPKFYQEMRLKAIQLSKDRANAVKAPLAEKFKIDPSRLQTDGKGWDRPVSKSTPELNRRVEVQWFTVE